MIHSDPASSIQPMFPSSLSPISGFISFTHFILS